MNVTDVDYLASALVMDGRAVQSPSELLCVCWAGLVGRGPPRAPSSYLCRHRGLLHSKEAGSEGFPTM